jgi:hypothetical protein
VNPVKAERRCAVLVLSGFLGCLSVCIGFKAATAADSSSTAAQPVSEPAGSANSGWWDTVLRGGPTGPILGNHNETLGDFHITGFLQNQTGMWVNSSNLREFTTYKAQHSNSLSTERNWISVDTNYNIGPNSFFVRWYGVYEPAYPNENNLTRAAGPNTTGPISDFYNQWTVRDGWWRLKEGPLTVFTGRQIVIWGESISFRVCDVINPQDISYAFGFANLEQSRMPLWMLHPILDLPNLGPLASNDLEVVFAPGLQPLYTNDDYPDDRQVGRHNVLGSVDILPPAQGARFAGRPYPIAIPLQLPKGAPLDLAAFPQIVGAPGATRWYYPPATWSNAQEGVRLHTFLYDAELTSFYWYGHQITPTSFVSGTPHHQFISEEFPPLNDVGFTGNRPLYLPGRVAEVLPFVLRSELLLQDRTPINTQALNEASAVSSSSTLNTLVALDLASAYAPWLTQTGTLTTHLEWNNYTILSWSKKYVYGGSALHRYHNDEQLLLSLGTSWLWNEIAPTLTGIYNPDGTTFELFPDLLLTPHWSNLYSLDLKYIGILGNNKYGGATGGVFKGKSLLVMTFQYNFNLL